MRILHVLTYGDSIGSYGGPLNSSSLLCEELVRLGHDVTRIYGSDLSDEMLTDGGIVNHAIKARSLLPRFRFSSIFSLKLLSKIKEEVKANEFVHLHFERSIVSYAVYLNCKRFDKPLAIQPHGMYSSKGRRVDKILDRLVFSKIISYSSTIFVLNSDEFSILQNLAESEKFLFLPNGIRSDTTERPKNQLGTKRVIFCSRIHPRKGLGEFLRLAKLMESDEGISFHVFGGDQGDLWKLHKHNETSKITRKVNYGGALSHGQSLVEIRNSSLLILPSAKEPFPMVILEALGMGVPVICYRSSGISGLLREIDPLFVVEDANLEETHKNMLQILQKYQEIDARADLQHIALQIFDIRKVAHIALTRYTLSNSSNS
jgi:glycosyltransferase involved in cell wall biosynthesis